MASENTTTARQIIRRGRLYYADEEDGCHFWVNSRRHALRMTETEAERMAAILRRYYSDLEVEAV